MDDPNLVDRLRSDPTIKFEKVIPQENSTLLNAILSWVLPFMLLFGLGRLLSKQMQKKMGSGIMQFGKSNAKIYVESQTGKTFEDVAGQDEAKEALTEIVDFCIILRNMKKLVQQCQKEHC